MLSIKLQKTIQMIVNKQKESKTYKIYFNKHVKLIIQYFYQKTRKNIVK